MGITSRNYQSFQKAYAFFNRKLFGNQLPEVLITLQRASKAYGYFWADQFKSRSNDQRVDEIAMNPDGFYGRSDELILSTLVHEMAHVWQQYFGKPSRNGYHNAQWAAKMIEIGLLPTSTGLAGGKMTGQKMTHIIIPDCAYQKAFKRLVSQRGFKLSWQATPAIGDVVEKAKKASKTKYTCLICGQNAWAKPGSLLLCGTCFTPDLEGENYSLFVMTEVKEDQD